MRHSYFRTLMVSKERGKHSTHQVRRQDALLAFWRKTRAGQPVPEPGSPPPWPQAREAHRGLCTSPRRELCSGERGNSVAVPWKSLLRDPGVRVLCSRKTWSLWAPGSDSPDGAREREHLRTDVLHLVPRGKARRLGAGWPVLWGSPPHLPVLTKRAA